MAIKIKIKEGSMNTRTTTRRIGRGTTDVLGDPDRTKLAEEDNLDEKR